MNTRFQNSKLRISHFLWIMKSKFFPEENTWNQILGPDSPTSLAWLGCFFANNIKPKKGPNWTKPSRLSQATLAKVWHYVSHSKGWRSCRVSISTNKNFTPFIFFSKKQIFETLGFRNKKIQGKYFCGCFSVKFKFSCFEHEFGDQNVILRKLKCRYAWPWTS